MSTEQRDQWRMKRLMKRITLTEISKHLTCSHALLSMWESGGYMAEDKVKDYMEYIEKK